MLSWSDVSGLPLPPPGIRIAYGASPLQFGELRLPQSPGPYPVVAIVHGGCWLSDFDYRHITPLAAALAREGYATWTVEYRRLGDDGGGWPGSLLDAGAALDRLRALAPQYALDLQRVRAIGHSAGGQLALWLASRARLPPGSALYAPEPLSLQGVLGLAPITDLARYRVGEPGSCNASVERLLGGAPDTVAERYAQASPIERLPLGVPVWLLQGTQDRIVPAAATRAFAQAARLAGDEVTLVELERAGHFEPVVVGTAAWPELLRGLRG